MPASGENFPLLLAHHFFGAAPCDPGGFSGALQGGATGFFAHVDFPLAPNAADAAGFFVSRDR